jgi:hypothetical protein
MARFLTQLCGPDNWVYDERADVWVVSDTRHDGPGRGFLVLQRGGDWYSIVIPDERLQ